MRKTNNLISGVMAVCIALAVFSMPVLAQEGETDPVKKAEAEMQAALGTVPVMFKVYPEHLRASAWEWFKATMSPDAPIPGKYSQLISLAVASQIPCSYCVYAHTTMAKMLGATDAEIQGAVASAADTRHWSTVMNGAGTPLDEFKKEWDGILAHMQKQSATQETTKK